MDFSKTLPAVVSAFQSANLHFALIGGLAIAFHGIQRATLDADFILLLDDLDQADQLLQGLRYSREFHSENVSHYTSQDRALGRIDILHASRPITKGMLQRAQEFPLPGVGKIPVADREDIIGLKIQASHNDPSRHRQDWSDIYSLIEHSAQSGFPVDWERIEDYLELFDLGSKLTELRQIHASSLQGRT